MLGRPRLTVRERIASLEAFGVLACYCPRCDRVVCILDSNPGMVLCMWCARPTLDVWCRARLTLIPEEEGECPTH